MRVRAELLPFALRARVGFFFSSGRRHTRSLRDWSSDVCSSDLEFPQTSANARLWGFHTVLQVPLMREGVAIGTIALRRQENQRSEERRVGKGCKAPWSSGH